MPGLWRDANFLKLWTGQTISEIGSRVTREGLPMTAVMVLGVSTAQMGLLQALGGIAALIGGAVAGIVVDRYHRKPILVAADLGRALALAVIPIAAAQGWLSLSLLIAVTAVTGLLTVFFDVAYQSIVPSLVRSERLLEANSKLALSASTAEVIGPAMTGMLIQAFTAPRAILIDSISFLASAVSLLWMKVDESRPQHLEEPSWRDVTAGLRYVTQHNLLRPLALRTACFAFFGGWVGPLYVLFAIRELGISPTVLGIVIAIGGVSNFFGALLAARIGSWLPTGFILIASTLLASATIVLIPLGHGPVMGALFLALAQLLGDVSFPVYAVHELTLRQRIASEEMLGRVNAFMQMLFKGVYPFGALIGGFIAQQAGIRTTFLLAAAGVLAGGLVLLFSDIRKLK
jgi:predicted MFS family arabinose efflux permease